MQTEIIAHRGASAYAPENTMYAFEEALTMHADGIETDVHLTKDHIPVLMHDERINRTSNGKGFIRDYTYEQIIQFDIGSWFSSEFANATIVTLDQFLTWIKGTPLHAHIEIKNNKIDYPNIEAVVYEHICKHQMEHRTTVSSFNFSSIQRFKELSRTIEIAYLTSKMSRKIRSSIKKDPVDALHMKHTLLKRQIIRCSKQKEIPLRIFTINKISQMMRCFDVQVKGIFTDVPDIAYDMRCNWIQRKD